MDNRFKGSVHIFRQSRRKVGPAVYGWMPGSLHPEYGKIVYRQGRFKLMEHPSKPGWILQDGDRSWHFETDVRTITRDMRDICPVCGLTEVHDQTHGEQTFVSGPEWDNNEQV